MTDVNQPSLSDGDEVMKAVGELSSTAKDAAKSIAENQIDHEEAKQWFTILMETILKFLK